MSRDLKPGDTLGRFRLLLELGTGGMGRVWVACRIAEFGFSKLVAIKTRYGWDSSAETSESLFLDEARLAALIRHPNACSMHELGEQDGILYFTMDFCDGATLRQLLDAVPGRRLAPAVAARIVAQACAGLQAVHELTDDEGTRLDVVHRDVSPHNILIGTNGHVRISDFGVAKARGQLHERTKTGELRGKVHYLAPEQVLSQTVDCRADVFAMGCVLYESSLGRAPFRREEELATLYQLVEGEPARAHSLDADYPEALEAVLARALAKRPEQRFQSAAELGRALEAWLGSTGIPTTEADVAGVLDSALGTRIAERNQRIRLALEERARAEDAHATSDLGIERHAWHSLEDRETSPIHDPEPTQRAIPASRPRSRSAILLGGAALGAIALSFRVAHVGSADSPRAAPIRVEVHGASPRAQTPPESQAAAALSSEPARPAVAPSISPAENAATHMPPARSRAGALEGAARRVRASAIEATPSTPIDEGREAPAPPRLLAPKATATQPVALQPIDEDNPFE